MSTALSSDDELESQPPSDQSSEAESVMSPNQKRKRAEYPASFKCEVVRAAMQKPASCRIKPTAREFPGVQPVQVRRWLRAFAPMLEGAYSETAALATQEGCDEREGERFERDRATKARWCRGLSQRPCRARRE